MMPLAGLNRQGASFLLYSLLRKELTSNEEIRVTHHFLGESAQHAFVLMARTSTKHPQSLHIPLTRLSQEQQTANLRLYSLVGVLSSSLMLSIYS